MGERDWPKELRGLIVGVAWIAGLVAALFVAGWSWDAFLRPEYLKWRCKPTLQADLDELYWMRDPRVEKCTGAAERATCFVSTLDAGQRRTAPVTNWDCSFRRLPNGVRNMFEWAEEKKATTPQVEAAIPQRLRMSPREFNDRIDYVMGRFAEREQLLTAK